MRSRVVGLVASALAATALAQVSPPDCEPEYQFTTAVINGVTIKTPQGSNITRACQNCCDRIVISNLPPTAIVEGWAIVTYAYTFATSPPVNFCNAAKPLYSYIPGTTQLFWTSDREVIYKKNISYSGGGTHIVELCYPERGQWKSPELHVDFYLTVRTSEGAILVPGYTGGSGWDPSCDVTGCTPGYWKNHAFPSGVSPNAYFDAIFGAGPHITLLSALSLGGGGENALIRHAVAAYLNALAQGPLWCYQATLNCPGCNPLCTQNFPFYGLDFPYLHIQIIDMVKAAYANPSTMEIVKNQLELSNETLCSLDSNPRWFGYCACTNKAQFCDYWLKTGQPWPTP